MQIKSIGIDLGETTFHLVALGSRFQGVIRKKFFPRTPTGVHGQSAFIADRDGGGGGIALSGTCPARTRARGTSDSRAGTLHAQTFTILYNFTNGPDSVTPNADLLRDQEGNLYGTTCCGGTAGWGTVFKLDKRGHVTVLHSFTGSPDGAYSMGDLGMDKAGNLYGTTANGGSAGVGTVFKVNICGNRMPSLKP